MSDIQPGDVVVYVSTNCGSGHRHVPKGFAVGRIYRVLAVTPRHSSWKTNCPCGIKVEGITGKSSSGTCGARFRKIRPADPEFIADMQRLKEREPA